MGDLMEVFQMIALVFGTVEIWPETRLIIAEAIDQGSRGLTLAGLAINHNFAAQWRKLLAAVFFWETLLVVSFGLFGRALGLPDLLQGYEGFYVWIAGMAVVGVLLPLAAIVWLRNVRPINWARYRERTKFLEDLREWNALSDDERNARIADGESAPLEPAGMLQSMDEFGPHGRFNAFVIVAAYLPPFLVAGIQLVCLLRVTSFHDIPVVYMLIPYLSLFGQMFLARKLLNLSVQAVAALLASAGDFAQQLAKNIFIRPVLVWAGLGLTEANFDERIKLALVPFSSLRDGSKTWDWSLTTGVAILLSSATVTQHWVHVVMTGAYLVIFGVGMDFGLNFVGVPTAESRKAAMKFIVGLTLVEFVFQCVRTIEWLGRVSIDSSARYATVASYWNNWVVSPVNHFFHTGWGMTILLLIVLGSLLWGVLMMKSEGGIGRIRLLLASFIGVAMLCSVIGRVYAMTHAGATAAIPSWGYDCTSNAQCDIGAVCRLETHTCSVAPNPHAPTPTVAHHDVAPPTDGAVSRVLAAAAAAPPVPAAAPAPAPVVTAATDTSHLRSPSRASAPVGDDRCEGLRRETTPLVRREGRCL